MKNERITKDFGALSFQGEVFISQGGSEQIASPTGRVSESSEDLEANQAGAVERSASWAGGGTSGNEGMAAGRVAKESEDARKSRWQSYDASYDSAPLYRHWGINE